MMAFLAASCATVIFGACAAETARRRAVHVGDISRLLLLCLIGDAWLATRTGMPSAAVVAVAGAIVAAIVDARTGFIFDPLVASIVLGTLAVAAIDRALFASIEGCAGSAAALGAIWLATRGTGIGLGDVKLAAAIGAGLGLERALWALAFAFVFGAVYGLALIAVRRASRRTALPFAPFIAAGAFVAASFPQIELR
jgi:prepilin signal peptidase PulO-like enzyme (type II secretory pathway)